MKTRIFVAIVAVSAASALVPVASASAGRGVLARPTAAGIAVAKSDSGSYVVVMKASPLLARVSQSRLGTRAAVRVAGTMQKSHDVVLSNAGIRTSVKVHDYTNALNGFSALLSHRQAQRVAADPNVALVLPDSMRQPQRAADAPGERVADDDLGNFVGLTEEGEAWQSGITGEGVIVGVIDTGIWPEHPSFADDGSYPPHASLDDARPACEFGNTAHNPDDDAFRCNDKLIGARQMLDTYRAVIGADDDEFDSARDDDGHGTHTASTAAGNARVRARIFGRDYGRVSGIAPRAQVVAYKALGNLGGFTSDLAAAIDQAVEDGVDVINYSVGGGPSLLTADTIAFLFAGDAGVFVAASAGNDGPGPETIGGPADVPWLTSVGANTQSQFFEGRIKLSDERVIRGASVTRSLPMRRLVDAEFAGASDLCLEGTLDPARVTGKIVLCRRGGNGRVAKSFEVMRAGGAGMILYNNDNVDNLFSDNFYVPAVHVDFSPGLAIKRFIGRQPNARASLTAGARTTWPSAPSMTIFSSRGPNPTAPDIIKPDITAPGQQILAGASPFPTPGDGPQGELFQAIAGTSMSSPVVAGVYALLKQAHPLWSPAAAKSALMTSARIDVVDNDRVTRAKPFAMGAGMVRPGEVRRRGSAFNPGLVYDAGFLDYLGFLCDEAPEAFGSDADEVCADLAGIGVPTDATDLNLASIGVSELAGRAIVTRTVTSVSSRTRTFQAVVQSPPGYTTRVIPARLTLDPGESASFRVVITNSGRGTIGRYRFGSLTWESDGGHVRSPIAVRGVQLSAPTEVAATGTAGTATIPVRFGYTGAYTATAHGLVAPAQLAGSVSQDPDQTFPSDDDGAGVDLIPIAVNDAALLRLELVIPGPDDIDLYLLDPAGEIIAQSTNGGTDEHIELVAPANGTYTLAVHGWAIGGASLAYSISEWLVPGSSGGNLSVSSSPASATLGTTANVVVAWSGLSAGTRYLGAVAHRDATGVVALTTVTVDT